MSKKRRPRSPIRCVATTVIVLMPLLFAVAACHPPPPVDLSRVTTIESDGRFVAKRPGTTPVVERGQWILSGDRLRRILDKAVCHRGNVLWKGGIPAALFIDNGERIDIDGFSFYGRFLRVHGGQWCEFPDDVWDELWTDETAETPSS